MFQNMNKTTSILAIIFLLTACGLQDGDDKMNLVIYSAEGDLEGVEEFITKVDDVNFVSLKGGTPLNSAVHNGHLDIVRFLIENGASCSYKDGNDKTALAVAIEQNHKEVQMYLQALPECANET